MLYDDLVFPEPPNDRPYAYANMVATIDGRTVLGSREESVRGLGSAFDQRVMDVLESKADAILLGAGSIRANPPEWNPHCPIRIAISAKGDLPWDAAFFTGGMAFVACPEDATFELPMHVAPIRCGTGTVDLRELLTRLVSPLLRFNPPLREGREGELQPGGSNQGASTTIGQQEATPLYPPSRGEIRNLHVLGGSALNGELLRQDLLDELFLTIAPKIKLGYDLPTYATGDPLPKTELKQFSLVQSHVEADEVFLRYRRAA